MAIAAAVVVLVAAVVILVMQHGKGTTNIAPVSAASDPYAENLPLTGFSMSEAGNLAGGKVTYLDGHISNKGSKTVTGVKVQVLFRNTAQEVAQNESQILKVVRMRTPYVDIEPVSAAPLKPGDEKDFRLIFDAVSPDWDGAYPQVRILRVETQ
jgi:hypothetical protein